MSNVNKSKFFNPPQVHGDETKPRLSTDNCLPSYGALMVPASPGSQLTTTYLLSSAHWKCLRVEKTTFLLVVVLSVLPLLNLWFTNIRSCSRALSLHNKSVYLKGGGGCLVVSLKSLRSASRRKLPNLAGIEPSGFSTTSVLRWVQSERCSIAPALQTKMAEDCPPRLPWYSIFFTLLVILYLGFRQKWVCHRVRKQWKGGRTGSTCTA